MKQGERRGLPAKRETEAQQGTQREHRAGSFATLSFSACLLQEQLPSFWECLLQPRVTLIGQQKGREGARPEGDAQPAVLAEPDLFLGLSRGEQ